MDSKNKVLTTLLIFFITLEVLIALDYIVKQQDMLKKRTTIYQSLIELQNQIGYVGLIHNFKNAILRSNNDSYLKKALINQKIAYKQIIILEKQGQEILGSLTFHQTRTMLNAYKKRINELPKLIKQGFTIQELDTQLRFDDEPSHSEIETISLKMFKQLDNQFSTLLFRSLYAALFTLLALLVTLVAIIRYYFLEHQQALKESEKLNRTMKENKSDILRSQSVLLSLMEDVEQEKQQTSNLNSRLQKKNNEMKQFIYTVSHDLKSPLVTINGFASQLKRELSGTLTEKQSHRLNRISENVQEMELLLTDLLDLSRIVQQEVTKSLIELTDALKMQLQLLENEISESKAKIIIAENLARVYCNERLLGQCLLNLLSNSLRYRALNRELIIKISTTSDINTTSIHIRDNGIGIDPKYHELIFGIFEKLSTTMGTGVGLTIVSTIMDKHNGQVSVTSNLGEGSCFTLTFPNIDANS